MTILHVVARVLIYGSAWALTATCLLALFDWADKSNRRINGGRRYPTDPDNRFAALLVSTFIWAIIIGAIYW